MTQNHYNRSYTGNKNTNIAYPLGGLGSGMIGFEGRGAFSHVSIQNTPDINNEPIIFSALYVKTKEGDPVAKVLEGKIPDWKIFRKRGERFGGPGNGMDGRHYGLPRFAESEFQARFPFGTVKLEDPGVPLNVSITGWSPFIPQQADDSSLPVAGLEYTFENTASEDIELVYSFHAKHFVAAADSQTHRVTKATSGTGFVLEQPPLEEQPWTQAAFTATSDHPAAQADCAWFRGGWFDPITMVWNKIESGGSEAAAPYTDELPGPGGSLYIPLQLKPNESQTVRIMLSWYVPETHLTIGVPPQEELDEKHVQKDSKAETLPEFHKPWYAGQFHDSSDIADYWLRHYDTLREQSSKFTEALYDTSLPDEIMEAVTANLCILKSPTILRQTDGRIWGWEGCHETGGSCHGTCTHVWSYAQSLAHLFPELERGIRRTEFEEGQAENGHQNFRVPLPIQPASHEFHAASDGQLSGIMQAYREWRISGSLDWLRVLWPKVKKSLRYCMDSWDPDRNGVLSEPHHNTYDIEFWGPNGMCSSVYVGALKAASLMAAALGEQSLHDEYDQLYRKGKHFLEHELFNGEYFEQRIQWEGLHAPSPVDSKPAWNINYSPEARELLKKEGPKYQYGTGCLSDGIIGAWFAEMCGLGDILDREKVKSHLLSVYKYNLRRDLSEHANPQRPGYAINNEGGLLLCTWPRGGKLSLPFVYSNEVWTGIEYQVASHLLSLGCIEEGLDIVRICRDRYDGRVRNPFDEYECGHWYARAMASYGLIQGWSGIRYDAVEEILWISPRMTGDYTSFLSTASGYGHAGIKDGKPFVDVKQGTIPVKEIKLA